MYMVFSLYRLKHNKIQLEFKKRTKKRSDRLIYLEERLYMKQKYSHKNIPPLAGEEKVSYPLTCWQLESEFQCMGA